MLTFAAAVILLCYFSVGVVWAVFDIHRGKWWWSPVDLLLWPLLIVAGVLATFAGIDLDNIERSFQERRRKESNDERQSEP